MLDKDREFRVQMDILAKAYVTLDKVQELLLVAYDGMMVEYPFVGYDRKGDDAVMVECPLGEVESLLTVADMVKEVKSHLDEVGKRWREVILEEDIAAFQRTVDEYFPDPSS